MTTVVNTAASLTRNFVSGLAAIVLVLGLATSANAQQSGGSIKGTVAGASAGTLDSIPGSGDLQPPHRKRTLPEDRRVWLPQERDDLGCGAASGTGPGADALGAAERCHDARTGQAGLLIAVLPGPAPRRCR